MPNYTPFVLNAASRHEYGVDGNKASVILLKCTADSLPATALWDTGAEAEFISHSFVKSHGLQSRMTLSQQRVKYADGSVKAARGELVIQLRILTHGQPFERPIRFIVADLQPRFDLILGIPFCKAVEPRADFARMTILLPTLQRNGQVVWQPAYRASTRDKSPLDADGLSLCELSVDGLQHLQDIGQLDNDLTCVVNIRRHLPEPAACSSTESAKSPDPKETEETARCEALRQEIFAAYADVFPDALPQVTADSPAPAGITHTIQLKDGAQPYSRPLRRMSTLELDELKKQLEEYLASGRLRPSESPWGTNVIFAKKKDGALRFCVDYRGLNDATVRNSYPLPLTEDLFDRLTGARFFSIIDLRTGFYQILIAEKDRHKTAFSTSQGLFEYNVLPMGLCNSPGVFMALMNDTFRAYLDQFVLVFLDDIIVYSDTLEDHERHLRLALQRLREQRLCAKLSKSALCQTEVEFLGHYFGRDGLRVMEDKIDTVRDWPVPTTIRELRAFLGLAGYYRRFVKGFSGIALPLTELTRNVTHQRLQWGSRQQLAFIELKRALQSTPVLALPDPALPFVVNCDASGYAVGAVLQQDRGSGLQPIAFMSKKLTGAESRYPVHEQELLAIITALTTWRHYLSGTSTPVRVRTDHKSLIHFQTQPMLSGRQTRWLETLADYDYTIEYVKGEDNEVADALSRRGDLNDGTAKRPPAFVDTKRAFTLNHIMTRTERTPLIDEINAIQRAEQHAPRQRLDRQSELRRLAERARATAAAKLVRPEAEVPADRPAPDAAGVIVMPTQRCAADNKQHAQCGCKTAKGQHCHVHMRSLDGLRVTKSAVAGAGNGLFAARDFAVGDHLADYTGDELIIRRDGDGGPYCLALSRRRAIDAAPTNTGYGRWANDPRGSGGGPNAEFVLNTARGTGRLRATARIRKGDEIFVSYGAQYWATFGSNAKVVVRPARAPHRAAAHDVIDLTSVVSTTFSSELAAQFDAACAADAAYAARLARGDIVGAGDELVTRDGRLFTRSNGALYVPRGDALRTRLIRECHDSATAGHLGRDKTVEQMQRRFFWHGMTARVGEYVTTCDACQRNKPSQRSTPGLLMPIASPTRAGHT